MKLRPLGSTLTGMLVSITCAGLSLLLISSATAKHGGLNWMALCSGLDAQNQNASRVISQDLQFASRIESSSMHQFVLKSVDGNTTYTFDPVHRTLTRAVSSKSENLLSCVDSFSYSLWRPDPFSTSGALVPAGVSNARAVACAWSSSWRSEEHTSELQSRVDISS